MTIRIPKTISEEEVKKLIEAANLSHHKLAIRLGFYQAMRISEIVKLRPEDVDDKWIHIKEAKGKKDRDIPITPGVRDHLGGLPIPCNVRALQLAIKQISLRSIGKDIHPHTLRHSGATHYLYRKNVDLRSIQVFLGHSNLETTSIYLNVTPHDLMEKFGRV